METEVIGYDENRDAIKIAISAPAEDNKANIELIKFVSKQMKIHNFQCLENSEFSKQIGKKARIVSGKTSKLKLLKLQ